MFLPGKDEIIDELDNIIKGDFVSDSALIEYMEFLLSSAKSFNGKHIEYTLEKTCNNEDFDLFKYCVVYAKTHNIPLNLNRDNGYFASRCAATGQLEMLKVLFENGVDMKIDDEYVLALAADYGQIEVVEIYNCDPSALKGYSSYNNYPHIMEYFDNYCELHNPKPE